MSRWNPARWWVIAQFRRECRRLVKDENLTPETARRFAAANVEWHTRMDPAVAHNWIEEYIERS